MSSSEGTVLYLFTAGHENQYFAFYVITDEGEQEVQFLWKFTHDITLQQRKRNRVSFVLDEARQDKVKQVSTCLCSICFASPSVCLSDKDAISVFDSEMPSPDKIPTCVRPLGVLVFECWCTETYAGSCSKQVHVDETAVY